jgi:glycerophosphoryl diester phosphodiesterase
VKSSKIIIILSIALALLFAIVVFYNFATAGEAISEDKISWIKETPIAHRGLHTKDIPENSLSAFENALKNNYAIELDVQFTKDKEVVVFHDENLKRMTNDTRNIEDVNYDELKNLRLGNTNEIIPTLEEVLELVDSKVAILIEIKDCKDYIELSEKTYEILKGYEGNYAIQSFNPFILEWYKNNASEVVRGQLSGTFTEGSESLNSFEKFALKNMLLNFKSKPNYIGYDLEGIPKSKLESLRKKGVPIIVWTVKNKEDMEKAYKYSDNITFENFLPK